MGTTERLMSVIGGIGLLALAAKRRGLRPWLFPLAGGMVWRGLSGRCPMNRMLGRNTARREEVASPVASVAGGTGIKVEQRVVVDRPRDEVYAFWRDFEHLPRFMEHLESVTVVGGGRSHWVAKAPAGTRVEWDAEIHNEIPNELIAWRSLPGADVNNAGSVHFTTVPGGTEVRVVLSYEPPVRRVGAAVARLFGENPEQQVADDLRRFKQVVESGELAPPSGPRV